MNKPIKNILFRLSMLLLLAGVVALMVGAKVNRERTPVSGIEVNIGDELNEKVLVRKDEVKKLINSHFNVQDKMMTGVILKKIEQLIEEVPQVSKASAYINDNGVLQVEVEQRMPVARVYAISGASFYIDEAGYKFPLSPVNTVKVPVITGQIMEEGNKVEKIHTPNLKAAFDVQQQLQKKQLWQSLIGQININDKNQVELVPRLGNAIVLLGTPDDLEAKMKKLDVFYTEVLGKQGWDKYKVINIMYKDQVVCLK